MLIVDVLNIDGKYNKETVERRLNRLGNELFDFEWDMTRDYSSATEIKVENEQYHVNIGTGYLYDSCDLENVNKAGYVLAVQHMYHEHRHVQQFTAGQQTIFEKNMLSTERRMTDIVRRNFIMDRYGTIYSHTYRTDPSEMDAELYGIEKAVKYFEKDPIVSKTEAEDILIKIMLSDDYGHKEELEPYNIQSIEDLASAFTDLREKGIHKPYQINQDLIPGFADNTDFETDMTDRFLTEHRFKYFKEEFDKCQDGRMQDKILEQTIVMEYPEIINTIPRLKKELKTCQEQMQSRMLLNRKEPIPVSKIQYANHEDDFTEAVNSISADENIKQI